MGEDGNRGRDSSLESTSPAEWLGTDADQERITHERSEGEGFYLDPEGLGSEIYDNQDFVPYYDSPVLKSLGEVASNNKPFRPILPVCFNCGSSSHKLPQCPDPFDRARITRAREDFKTASAKAGDHTAGSGGLRIHEAGIDRARRLYFLERFAPGRITQPLLREALGLLDSSASLADLFSRENELYWFGGAWGDGRGGMLKWGYPPGYFAVEDPTETVRRRIQGTEDEDFGDALLKLFGDEDASPTAIASPSPLEFDSDTQFLGTLVVQPIGDTATLPPSPSPDVNVDKTSSQKNVAIPRRWVPYPTTLFQWGLLPISQVYVPTSISSQYEPEPSLSDPLLLLSLSNEPRPSANRRLSLAPAVSSTFTNSRKDLWEKIVYGTSAAIQSAPWRDPNVWRSWYIGAGSGLHPAGPSSIPGTRHQPYPLSFPSVLPRFPIPSHSIDHAPSSYRPAALFPSTFKPTQNASASHAPPLPSAPLKTVPSSTHTEQDMDMDMDLSD